MRGLGLWFEEAYEMAPLYTGAGEVCPFWVWAMGHISFACIIGWARRSLQLFGQHMGTISDNLVRVFIHGQFQEGRCLGTLDYCGTRKLGIRKVGYVRGGWPMSYYLCYISILSIIIMIITHTKLFSVSIGKR